jgi:glycosyltransferase involved in cell wall biosynthesis
MAAKAGLNILHLIETKGPGGAETVFMQLACGLAARGHGCVAAVTGQGWLHGELARRGVQAAVLPTNGSFDLRFLAALRALIVKSQAQIVHAHLPGANLYATMAGLLTGRPVVATFHGQVDVRGTAGLLASLKGKVIGRAAAVVAVSNSLKCHLCQGGWLPARKVHVVYNGVDLAVFAPGARGERAALGFGPEDLLIGMVGNIRRTKGHEHLIRAAALVRRRHPRVHVLIAGHAKEADLERLKRLQAELGLADTVHFLGFREDVARLLACLDVFALASTAEGFSIATVEAMAMGLPVVATRSGGPEEIITPGRDGLLVDPGSAEALAEGIMELLADWNKARSLGEEAARTARERFSLEAMLDRYEALYYECVGGGGLA